MVVGRRKLLALVANDRRPERSTLRDSDFVEYFNIRNIHVIKKDLLLTFFFVPFLAAYTFAGRINYLKKNKK